MTNFTKFLILTLSLCAISCAEKEFTDSVSLALAAGGEIGYCKMERFVIY